MSVFDHVSVCAYICVCVSLSVHISACVFSCLCIYLHVCFLVCASLCLNVCVGLILCLYLVKFLSVCLCLREFVLLCFCVCACVDLFVFCVFVFDHTSVWPYVSVCACVHTSLTMMAHGRFLNLLLLFQVFYYHPFLWGVKVGQPEGKEGGWG